MEPIKSTDSVREVIKKGYTVKSGKIYNIASTSEPEQKSSYIKTKPIKDRIVTIRYLFSIAEPNLKLYILGDFGKILGTIIEASKYRVVFRDTLGRLFIITRITKGIDYEYRTVIEGN